MGALIISVALVIVWSRTAFGGSLLRSRWPLEIHDSHRDRALPEAGWTLCSSGISTIARLQGYDFLPVHSTHRELRGVPFGVCKTYSRAQAKSNNRLIIL